MSIVRLTHPGLPGRVLEVDERRLGARLAAGWVRAADYPPAPADDAQTDPEPTEQAAPKRSRRPISEE